MERYRRAFLYAATAAIILGTVASAGAQSTTYAGTWQLAAAPGTLWASGGTLRITPGSASSVPAKTNQAAWDNYVKGYCLGGIVGSPPPAVSAWYSLSGSWPGSERMGGCVSDKTNGQLIFFGAGAFGHAARNGNQLFGDWTNNPNGSTRFAATLAAGSPTPTAGTTRTVAEPPPGHGVLVTSPKPLPTDCSKAAFRAPASRSSSCFANVIIGSPDLSDTTVVAEGPVTRGKLAGQLVTECWLLYDFDSDEPLDARQQFANCLVLVKIILSNYFHSHPAFPATPAPAIRVVAASAAGTAEAGGCRAQRLAFDVRGNKTRVSSIKRVAPRPSATSVLYRCSVSAGTMKINIDGRVAGGLRKALGSRLDLEVIRSNKAPKRRGKLTIAYGW